METSGRCQHYGQDLNLADWKFTSTHPVWTQHAGTLQSPQTDPEGDSPIPEKMDDLPSDGAPSGGKMSSLDEKSHFLCS